MSDAPVPELSEEENRGRTETTFIQVGERLYPVKHVHNCKTCRSSHRVQIEIAVINGLSYKQIMEDYIEPFDDHSPLGTPTYQGLLTHIRRKHMAAPYTTQRRLLERRAQELGRSIEESEELLHDSVGALRAVVQRGFERMNSGQIDPSISDMIRAAQLESALVASVDGETDTSQWKQALIAYMTAVKNNVAPEVFRRISEEVRDSPVMQQVFERKPRELG